MTQSNRSILALHEGELIACNGHEYVITKIVDLNTVIGKNVDTNKNELLNIWALELSKDKAVTPAKDLLSISDEDWSKAKASLEMIKPLLTRQARGSNLAAKIAQENGLGIATIYRMLQVYRSSGLLSSLLPTKRSGGKGKGRLSQEIDALIKKVIEDFYLTDQQRSVSETIIEIRRLCSLARLPLPHPHTIRKRINWIEDRLLLERRKGRRAAIHKFTPNEGSIPDANWPLAMTQIDHTKVDVMVVDEVARKSIGRPWITLAIDVNSRVIQGHYLTLDSPSALSAGMCISHAILPKEGWLQEIGLENVKWPCWGVMGIIHLDNAKEFRGNMLKTGCDEYDIDLMLRPVKTPHYGGHIERLMGTLATELTTLSGATFSNPKERGEYKSEDRATLTLKELEKWLVLFIAKYNHRIHSGIGMSPLAKYQEGLLGGNGKPARGLPNRRLDVEKLQLDFMPYVERTIQPYGVVIDDIYYFADVLRPWVGAADETNPKASRLFKFRRDPRDISQIYFFDPTSQGYFIVPYRDSSLPPVSLQELKLARKALDKKGSKAKVDESIIFEYIGQQREIESQSLLKTKAARKNHEKRLQNTKAKENKNKVIPKIQETLSPSNPPEIRGYNSSSTSYFEDEY